MHIFWQPYGRWMLSSRETLVIVLGCLLLTGVAAAQSPASPGDPALAPGTFRLAVTDSALSLEANAASLAAVCTAIGQQTGIAIILHPGAD